MTSSSSLCQCVWVEGFTFQWLVGDRKFEKYLALNFITFSRTQPVYFGRWNLSLVKLPANSPAIQSVRMSVLSCLILFNLGSLGNYKSTICAALDFQTRCQYADKLSVLTYCSGSCGEGTEQRVFLKLALRRSPCSSL